MLKARSGFLSCAIKRAFCSSGNKSGDKSFMIKYHYIEDVHYKRIPYHKEHIDRVQKFEENGANIIGGSLFPNTGAYLFVQCNNREEVEAFVKKDPFVENKLVTMYEIDELDILSNKGIEMLAKDYSYIAK